MPVGPVGPATVLAAPVGPVGPVGPATVLAAPVGPVGPVGPDAPVGPVGPVGPVTPEVIAKNKSWFDAKLVVPVPPDELSVLGIVQ